MAWRRLLCLVTLVAATAGCSDAPAPDGSATSQAATQTGMAAGAVNSTLSVPMVHRLDWNGTLTTGVWVCDGTATHQCLAEPAGAFGTDEFVAGLQGNLTSGTLVLAWTANLPLTQELVLEGAVFTRGCDDCEIVQFPAVSGPSPLTLELPAGVSFGGREMRLTVYSNQYVAQDAGAAGTSGDQPFRLTGDLLLQP